MGCLAENPVADLNRVVDLLLQTPNRVEGSLTDTIGKDDKALVDVVVLAVTLIEEVGTILGGDKLGELAVKLAVVTIDQLGSVVGTLSLVEVVLLDLPLKVFPVVGVVLPLVGLGRSLPDGLLYAIDVPSQLLGYFGISDVVVKLAHTHVAGDHSYLNGVVGDLCITGYLEVLESAGLPKDATLIRPHGNPDPITDKLPREKLHVVRKITPLFKHPVKLLRDDFGVLAVFPLVRVQDDVGHTGNPVLKFDVGSQSGLHNGTGFAKVTIDHMGQSLVFQFFGIVGSLSVDQCLCPRPEPRSLLILLYVLVAYGNQVVR